MTATIEVGSVIAGTYTIEALLGSGGMGRVFVASHGRLPGKHVAIKVLRSDLADADSRARFRREAEIVSRLEHPNIVAIADFNVTPEGVPYLVLEYLRGESLAERLHAGKIGLETALSIARQIGSALSAAHRNGVVHRDLKPQNVVLESGDKVKVLDFGISKLMGVAERTLVTQDRALLGTPQYMAPEQASGENASVDARTDVFALAAIVYEMLSGRPPFMGASIPELALKIVHDRHRPLRQLDASIPEHVARAVDRGLEKAPRERFHTMAAFIAALDAGTSPRGAVPDAATLHSKDVSWVGTPVRSALIGRDRDLAELGEVLADARRGDGQLALVAGEPGIGKTRLVDAASRSARELGQMVVWGRCWEAGGAPAFWLWIQIVRAIHRDRPDVALPAELAWMLGGTGAADPVADDRFVLFDATLQYLAAAAHQRPLAIVLEDLHGADQPSLNLLAFIASHLAGTSVAVVGTYRTTEARMTPEVGAILDRLARAGRVIAPRRLERADIAALVGSPGDAETIDAIYRTSEGNPLFACELLRLLRERPRTDGQLAVPETVRAAIREHLRRLPPALRELATLAAVIGRDVAGSLVAELAERDERATLIDLRALVDHGVLTDPGPRRFRFAHILFAETLHHDLPQEQREQLHGRVADLLERDLGGDATLAEVAHHRFEAGQHAQAIDAALAVAEEASRQLGFEEATLLLERALTVTPRANLAKRCDLLVALGLAQIQADHAVLGKATCCQAAELARALRSGDRLARSAITYGRAFFAGVVDQVLINLIDEALGALPEDDSSLRAQLLARRAGAMQPADDPGPPMAIARDAIAMARRLGDDATLLSVLYGAMSALANFAPGRERVPLDREAIELAIRLNEPTVRLRSTYRLILDHLDAGELASARSVNAVYQELSAKFRQPRLRVEAALVGALLAHLDGHLSEHTALVTEARAVAHALPFREMFIASAELFSRLQLDDDSWIEQRDPFLSLVQGAWQQLYRLASTPFLYARSGELDRARAAFSLVRLDAVVRYQDLLVFSMMSETAILLNDRAAAATLYDALGEHDDRWCAAGLPSLTVWGPVSQLRFKLAALLGRSTARGHAVAMLAALRAAGSPLLLVRGLVAWATSTVCERAAATMALAEARTIAIAHSLPVRAEIERHLALLEAPAPEAPGGAIAATRDGDTWVVVAGGQTCRIKDSRGMELLAKLLAEPGRELHVLELVGADGADAGDAGEVIDREALAAYRARAQQLRAELDEAEAFNDLGRRARAEAELGHLEDELRAGAGLGGRPRKTTSAAERARVNVRRRIADAIARIGELAPVLGKHLDASVRTGAFCSYDPRRALR